MKNNYNIKTDLPKLDSEQINKHQDFDSLLAQFEQATPPKEDVGQATTDTIVKPIDNKIAPWIVKSGVGVLMTIAASVLVVFMIQNGNNNLSPTTPAPIALVSPVPDLAPTFERATIMDVEKAETLQYPSGSTVKVPASAFVDKKGLPIKGKVDIDYRELNNAVDLYLAGVPQELGKHKNIQSAGMIEIKGSQAGEPVYLHQDKTLEITFRGEATNEIAAADLNIYTFQGNDWEYQAVDGVKIVEEITYSTSATEQDKQRQQIQETWAVKKPVAPRKPQTVPNNMQPFDFDLDKEQFPDLAYLGDEIEFLVKKSAVADDPFAKEWNNMKVVDLGNDKLQVQLIRNSASGAVLEDLKLEIIPFIAYSDAAQARYNNQLAAYNNALSKWEKGQEMALAQLKTEQKTTVWVHHFEMNQFGLWACGKESSITEQADIETSFVNEAGAPQVLKEIFVSAPNQKQYYSIALEANSSKTNLKSKGDNVQIWGMTTEYEIMVATLSNSDSENTNTYTFRPVGNITTVEDMKATLTI